MATPFIGEIRLFAGNFAPAGWSFCDGSTLAIADNETLYTLIGTTYGGDGVQTFQLPDLRGRVPVHQGSGAGGIYVPGQAGGQENVTLTSAQLPAHTHALQTANAGQVLSPAGAYPAAVQNSQATISLYGIGSAKPASLSPASISPAGGGQPHANLQPYAALSYIIALFGIFPSQG